VPEALPRNRTGVTMPTARSRPADPAHPTLVDVLRDLRHTLNLPGKTSSGRTELDSLHALVAALYRIVDARVRRADTQASAAGDHLRTARAHLWQATEQMHLAFHQTPRPIRDRSRIPDDAPCDGPARESDPAPTICRRHLAVLTHVRAHCTPADLRVPLHGSPIRHTNRER